MNDRLIVHNFQSESKKSGDQFEEKVYNDLIARGFNIIQSSVYIPGTGCEIDFIADATEYVEAKGGNDGEKKRPGAKRTDNVKKAIANAVLIKSLMPEIYYVVYFSSEPNKDSYSDEMISLALNKKIIDEVRYIENSVSENLYPTLFDIIY